MPNKAPFQAIRTLVALLAVLALLGTASACSSSSDSAGDDTAADLGDVEPADVPAKSDALPADFPAIPLPEYDSVKEIGTGQQGGGRYSGRATFTIDAFKDNPVGEMIEAYGKVLVAAGYSALELDDEGSRIRGWSTQPVGDDGDHEVDITVYKDKPGELEIGGAHWKSVGDGE